MAESKFLKYQDKNNDGSIDICDDLEIAEIDNCPDCIPKPSAVIPDWKKRTIDEPFLNEKTCEYQVTVTTKYTTTISEDLLEKFKAGTIDEEKVEGGIKERWEEFVEDAIQALLDYYFKDNSDESVQSIKDAIEYTQYYLDPRPKSRLLLLYSVPFEDLNALEDAEDEEPAEEDLGDTEVTYDISDLKIKLIKIRKGLNLYSRYQKMYTAIDGGQLFFLENGSVFHIENYGDRGVFASDSLMGRVLAQLDEFFNQKGYNIAGVGNINGIFKEKITKVTFKFNNKFRLKTLEIYTETCSEEPIVFADRQLKSLNGKSSWKNPTAMAYLARLDAMEQDFTARVPKPWLEFIMEHTYPEIYTSVNAGYANTDPENSAGSCVADSLIEEGKQLGQDILDDVFSIGDAIAYKFHENICQSDEEKEQQESDLGLTWSGSKRKGGEGFEFADDPDNPDSGFKEYRDNIKAMAKEQAFKELEANDQVFVHLCAIVLDFGTGGHAGSTLKDLWIYGFDRLKECGLFDLMSDAIQCLLGGMTLEQALASMLSSALRAMGIEYLGDLFVGLPPEKQAELNALVQKKLEEGNLQIGEDERERDQTSYEEAASDTAIGDYTIPTPADLAAQAKEAEESSSTDRTLAKQFDDALNNTSMDAQQLSPNVVTEAYILALLDVYGDNLLELLDEINKFPGAPVVKKFLALVDCPRPPLMDPSIMDWIKDISLPWCRDRKHLTGPKLINPFGWIPSWADLWEALMKAIIEAVQEAIVSILMKIFIKICELIGSAICKALEVTGDLIEAAFTTSTFSELVTESLCGEDADEEQVNDTIVDMMSSLGVGGAALADTEQAISFAEDISSASTRRELMEAFLGEPSQEFLNIIDTVVEYEYPDYRDALNNKDTIGNMFKNMGNLMPAAFKDQMSNFVKSLPPEDQMPANPSLCATPEQLDNFKQLRCDLLGGRATTEQCEQMFDDLRGNLLDDLDDLGNILQKGIPEHINDILPPIVSDPGCDNGLIPFESDESIAESTAALSSEMDLLKMAFSYDMLGNGLGKHNWGLINMIMCDTNGLPFTSHQRKVFNDLGVQQYVDFYVNMDASLSTFTDGDADDEPGPKYAAMWKQRGAYPLKVAGWLEQVLQALALTGVSFESSNEIGDEERISKTFEELKLNNFPRSPQTTLRLPDLGYNYDREIYAANEEVDFVFAPRKTEPDMTLEFYDNGMGLEKGWMTGFNIEMFLSDMAQTEYGYANRDDDNVRIRIFELVNTALIADPFSAFKDDEEGDDESETGETIMDNMIFEFLAVDDTLSQFFAELNIDSPEGTRASPPFKSEYYTSFLKTFQEEQEYLPQIVLLKNILNENGSNLDSSTIKSAHDEFMSSITTTFVTAISENSSSFVYGAKFDDLTYESVKYVVDDGQSDDAGGTEYYEAKITADDGESRNIKNKDQILGISYDQYLNGDDARVLYLDPSQYGGNYMNPPLYIKPVQYEGWMAFIDVMFPEISPCKPYRTDVVDFADIDAEISKAYTSIPEDERLKSDPDCIVEKPYNRILERESAAGLQGLISAAIRIFVSAHFVQSLTTFTKFNPKFPDTYSSLYASYIVEQMERSFRDAQQVGWEFFNSFKDEEFWYAFLEQSVQLYGRRVDNEDIPNNPDSATPPQTVLDALIELNDMQQDYDYPGRDDLKNAKNTYEISSFKTLKNYRSEKNLLEIQKTEELAKLVLKELVVEQLNIMGEKFISNLKTAGMTPEIYDLDYYLLTDLTTGSELDLHKEIEEELVDLPMEEGEEHYTSGEEFYVFEVNETDGEFEEGEEYIGYYHVYKDEEGELIYMTGEYHNEEEHNVIEPFASKVIVPIGDVSEYGDAGTASSEKPFGIEKYISIDGVKYSPSEAQDMILGNDNTLNLSDVYPGTLEQVTDAAGKVVGLKGTLGVRYGLEFSISIGGSPSVITSVEVDALDLPIGLFPPLEGDSRLLFCLINLLKKDLRFRIITNYIFPLNKITALLAIYNDFAFLRSIGEVVVPKGDSRSKDETLKPGAHVSGYDSAGIPEITNGEPGWAHPKDRRNISPFIRTWDEWDREILTNSKRRIKKLFKNYYNSRDFTPGSADEDTGKLFSGILREKFRPAPGKSLLPWWQKRMLRTSPFNSEGELCENND